MLYPMKILVFMFLILSVEKIYAQVPRPDHIIDRNSGGFLELKPKVESPVERVYLYDDWITGKVVFKSGYEENNLPMKYDLKTNLLEIKTKTGIKVAELSKYKYFQFEGDSVSHTYLSSLENAKEVEGLLEELVHGKASLYAKLYLEIKPSNYNAAMDIGSKTDQYLKKEKLLLVKNDEVTDVTKKGKKILTYFDPYQQDIQNFVKQNSLSYKKKNDLAKMVMYYNRISSH
jgi:hypothetical protein